VILIPVQIYCSPYSSTMLSFFFPLLIHPFFLALPNIVLYFFILSFILFPSFFLHLFSIFILLSLHSFLFPSFFFLSFLLTFFLSLLKHWFLSPLLFSSILFYCYFSPFFFLLYWNNNCLRHVMFQQP